VRESIVVVGLAVRILFLDDVDLLQEIDKIVSKK